MSYNLISQLHLNKVRGIKNKYRKMSNSASEQCPPHVKNKSNSKSNGSIPG